MSRLSQPYLGALASVLVIVASMAFISLFAAPQFMGWVAFCLISFIPMEIVVGITWGCNKPDFAASCRQPVRGMLLVLITLIAGAVGGAMMFAIAGGGIGPPTPMLMMCTITMVVTTFNASIIFGGWPFAAGTRSPTTAGLSMLAACYVVNYLLFRLLFDYGFMTGAPVYVASLDPHGLFNANHIFVFYLTFSAIMFLVLNFELWPFTRVPGLMAQPALGLSWSLLCFILAATAYYVGIERLAMDPLQFMVKVPVPFIFGTIIVVNMLQGTLFGEFAQPAKGLLNAIASFTIGIVLTTIYGEASRLISGPLVSGPPSNEFETWVASALLGVTFPFLIFFADFFQFWPIRKSQ